MTFRVALTFDAEHPDRPTRDGVAESILAALERTDVRATFFIQGRWAEAYPETARLIPGGGHLVGNHSNFHARMPLFSEAGLASDVRESETTIRDVTTVDPRPWFRCPFGAGHEWSRITAPSPKASVSRTTLASTSSEDRSQSPGTTSQPIVGNDHWLP